MHPLDCSESRQILRVLLLLLITTVTSLQSFADATELASSVPTLYIIGDSTAASYPDDRSPLTGWAQVLHEYVDPERMLVENRARSGRSSRSFYDEGAWTPIREALRPHDWVFIQFGHNDEKKDDPDRFTDPATTFPAQLRRYVEETRAAGAHPVLLTPIPRNRWPWARKMGNTHGDYPDAVRALAQKMCVPLIDLHKLAQKRFERLGPDATTKLFMDLAPGEHPNYPEGKEDNTHLQKSGAREVCEVAVRGIKHLPIRAYLKGYRLPRYYNGFTKSGRLSPAASI